jgi:hypothetical protein
MIDRSAEPGFSREILAGVSVKANFYGRVFMDAQRDSTVYI